MELKIRIEMDNDAHANCPVTELEENFKEILYCISSNQMYGALHDSNGNTVGHFSIEE